MTLLAERAKTPEERLMLAFLIDQIKYAVNRRNQSAIDYIFEDTEESEGWALGFKLICTYFGYDVQTMRDRIKDLIKERKKIKSRHIEE